MFTTLATLISAALLSINPGTEPTKPKNLSFDASAYVTVNHQIRVAVEKSANTPVTVLLRNKYNEVLFHQQISKNQLKYAVKMDVNDLNDGTYELEIKSSEGSIRKQVTLGTPSEPVPQPTRLVVMN